jgi:cytoskeletal protein CcmA (bactofilin family)
MSIFRRDSEPEPPRSGSSAAAGPATAPGERRAAATPTHIAPGARITGQINGTSDLVVEGEVEGQIQLESSITIGPQGRVKGNVSARSVRIAGRVQGNVHGVEKVEILPTGRLEGDVIAPRVVLAEGAFFKGKVEMAGQGQGSERQLPLRKEGEP